MTVDNLEEVLGDMRESVLAALARGATRQAVWKTIVEHRGYWPRLEQAVGSLLRRKCATTALADELASEVTAMLSYRFRSEDEEFPWKPTGNFTHWLGRVLANACRDAWERVARRESRERQLSDGAWDAVVAAQSVARSESRDQWARMIEAITRLDHPCRTLLYQLVVDGAQQQEVARVMHRSASAVSEMKTRCIRALKRTLGLPREADA